MPQIKAFKNTFMNEEKLYYVYKFTIDEKESPSVMVTSEDLTEEQVLNKILEHLKNPKEAEKLGPRQ